MVPESCNRSRCSSPFHLGYGIVLRYPSEILQAGAEVSIEGTAEPTVQVSEAVWQHASGRSAWQQAEQVAANRNGRQSQAGQPAVPVYRRRHRQSQAGDSAGSRRHQQHGRQAGRCSSRQPSRGSGRWGVRHNIRESQAEAGDEPGREVVPPHRQARKVCTAGACRGRQAWQAGGRRQPSPRQGRSVQASQLVAGRQSP